MYAEGFTTEGTTTPVELFATDFPAIATKVTATPGGTLAAGTVLGRITSGGKYIQSLEAAEDGSEVPRAILAHDITAESGDVEAVIYITGHFRSAGLTFGTGHTAASTTDGLRTLGIHLG